MCSRKWLIPFSTGASKREPTRPHRETCVRCSWGNGATTTRKPLASVAVAQAGMSVSVFVFVLGATASAVHLRFLNVRLVDLDVAPGVIAQALDVERQRLVALRP